MVAFIADEKNKKLIQSLKDRGIAPLKKARGELEGKVFVFTGSLKGISRDEAARLVMSKGGMVSSCVSKNTDYVVAGEKAGSKLEKAKKLGVNVIDEEEFKEIVEK